MDATLQRLAHTVTEARSLEDLTRSLLEMLEIATGYDSVYLTTIDTEAGLQHVLYSRNVRRMEISEGLAVPWDETLCKRALEEGRSCTADVAAQWPDSEAARALGIRSYVSTPIEAGDQLYGTLCAASTESLELPPDAERLLRMFARLIGHHLEREALLQHLRRSNDELTAAVRVDPLTGLGNRRALLEELSRMLARGARERACVDVAFLDLDGLKGVNDLHGHEAGDRLIAAVGARLTEAVRAGDYAARYGGDEFVVLSPGAGPSETESLRRRLLDATRGRFDLGSTTIDYPGASVGIATAWPGDASQEVLARADQAMYEVKRSRRVARAS